MARTIITLISMWAAGFVGGYVVQNVTTKPQTTTIKKAAFLNGCMNGAAIIMNVVGLTANDKGIQYIQGECEKNGKTQGVWQ